MYVKIARRTMLIKLMEVKVMTNKEVEG